jgi:hypothetical protein
MPNTPTEPAAELRALAAMMWQTFVALQAEGFTEKQAIAIIGQMLAANANGDE